MKKIIVNGRFLIHRITGVERYATELLSELDKIIKPGEIEMAIPKDVEVIPKYTNIKVSKVGILSNRLWEHISFPLYVMKNSGVSLNLCNVAPLLNPGITCIHDVKIKAKPQYFSKKFIIWYNLLFKNQVNRCKKIITVSQFSKNEIIKYYNVNPNKIDVIYNSWQHYNNVGYDEHALEKYNLKKGDYYFSMCSLEPNKNFKWIAQAACKFPEQTFAVAGSINDKVFSNGLGFERPENMKLIGYVSDGEAKELMKDCKAFLFPTIYEGFGIPPMEAICAGCQCIVVSDTDIMHEIYGDNVNYIDYDIVPDNFEFKVKADKSVLNNFSWEKSAKDLYKLLKD